MHDVNELVGPAECPEPEFNRADQATQEQTLANANVWMFRDADWPYVGSLSTLALTTVTFGVQSGKIFDADVELNSFAVDLSTGDENVASDTLSIVTHEAGHFLGLAHSDADLATMSAGYRRGSVDFRTLTPDDEAGICDIYPPDRNVPECDEPAFIGGWAAECSAPASDILAGETDTTAPTIYEGCSCRSARGSGSRGGVLAFAALGLAFLRLRSRRRG
jgi:MYXO-CTERM domain-containing protein